MKGVMPIAKDNRERPIDNTKSTEGVLSDEKKETSNTNW